MLKKWFSNRYKNLAKFLKYYKKERKTVQRLVFVMTVTSSLGMTLPYFTSKRIIGITDSDFDKVLTASLAVIGILMIHHIFWFLWKRYASILTNRIINGIRNDLMLAILNTRYSELKQHTSGYYWERISDDTIEVSSFLSEVLGTLVDALTNFSFLVFIYVIHFQCGLLFSAGIIVLYLIDLLRIQKDLQHTERLKMLNEALNSRVNENVKGIKDIKGFIWNNLKIVNPNATEEEVKNACILANIYEEINGFDEKWDTVVVENGNNLSGGQKQRIAIARAILKNTKIILFDEPTSALDGENQMLFFHTINQLKQYKTILVIAHKYDDWKQFDNLFEVSEGKIRLLYSDK